MSHSIGAEHPNVIPIYDADEAGGVLYLAMRFVDGQDLGRLLELQGPLGPGRALDLLDHVARALDAAHAKGLVHRDVKPGNILIGSSADGDEIVYLTDFGLTKRTSTTTNLTKAGVFMGTPAYAAPEQFQGGAVDRRADVYALACVLFECLTAVLPYQRDSDVAMMLAHMQDPVPSLRSARAELPAALEQVLARGMAKDPAERYDSCRALTIAARAAVSGAATQAGTTPALAGQGPPIPPVPLTPPGGAMALPETVTAPAPGQFGGWAPPAGPPGPAPGWGAPVPPPGRKGIKPGLALAIVLAGLLVPVAAGLGAWAQLNSDDGEKPQGPVATSATTTTRAEPTPAERVKDYFAPVEDGTCSEVAEKDRLVGGSPVEIRCKPDAHGVDVSYVYFGSKKVMDDYTKFLQGRPDNIQISIDTTWKYTERPGDVGAKVSYYHPGSDSSYVYWTYKDDLMGAIASRSGKDEAALEKWWVDVDILRHD